MDNNKKKKLSKMLSIALTVVMVFATLFFAMPGISATEDNIPNASGETDITIQSDSLPSGNNSKSVIKTDENADIEKTEKDEVVKTEGSENKEDSVSDKSAKEEKEEPVQPKESDGNKEQIQQTENKKLDAPIKKNRSTETFDVTYHAGEGTFDNGSTENVVTFTRNDETEPVISKTPNIDENGVASATYSSYYENTDVVTITGASQLQIEVWYSTESPTYDWLAIYPKGITPNSANYSNASISGGKLGGHGSYTGYTRPNDNDSQYHKTFTVNGDTAQFYFRSDSSGEFYGYYAIVSADTSVECTNGEVKTPEPNDSSKIFKGWHLDPDLNDEIVTDLNFTENTELYAEYGDPDISISLIYFDSSVGGGRTALNSDTPCNKSYQKRSDLTGTLTLQVNYGPTDQVTGYERDYEPGEFSFKVYGLEKFGLESPTVPNNTFNRTHHTGTYNPETGVVEDDYWVFTNKTKISQGSNTSGMIQLSYGIQQSGSKCPIDDAAGQVWVEYGEDQKSNELDFSFNLKETEYTVTKSASKLTNEKITADAENYRWVAYNPRIATVSNSGILTPTNVYFSDLIPKECKAVFLFYYAETQVEMNEYTDGFVSIDNDLYKYSFEDYDENYNRLVVTARSDGYLDSYNKLFIGYPKTEYSANQPVNNSVEFFGSYNRSPGKSNSGKYEGIVREEETLGGATSPNVNLANLDIVDGAVLNLNVSPDRNDSKLIVSYIPDEEESAIYRTYASIGIVKSDTKHDFVYGCDTWVYSDTENNTHKLTDNEYYIKSIQYPVRIRTTNGLYIPEGDINYTIYGRVANTDNWVSLKEVANSNSASSTTGMLALDRTDIVEYKFVIDDLTYSIESNSFRVDNVIYITANNLDVSQDSYMYAVHYADVLDENSENQVIVVPTYNYTTNDMPKTGVTAASDTEKFGHTVLRKYAKLQFTNAQYSEMPRLYLRQKSDSNGYTDYEIEARTNIWTSATSVKSLSNYHMTLDLSPIFSLEKSENELKETLFRGLDVPNYISNSTQFEDADDYRAYLKEHVTITIDEDVSEDIKYRIHLDFDFSDEELSLSPLIDNYTTGQTLFNVFIPVRIYDIDVLDYNGIVNINRYSKPYVKEGETLYNGNTSSSDSSIIRTDSNTYLYSDDADFNNNNDTEEKVFRNLGTGNIAAAFEAQQELSKLAKTDKNTWKKGVANASTDSNYFYRLRVRTAAMSMTNLVMYDTLENNNPEDTESWHGEFRGVDLTRSAAQGYIPDVYYATVSEIGKLGEDPRWQPYNDTIDKTTVKALAFDYGEQMIQPNAIASVDIMMHSPNEDPGTYAYNKYNAEWNRVDPATGRIFDDKDHLESNTTIISLNENIADTKTIKIIKVWEGDEEFISERPDSIQVDVLQDNAVFGTYTIQEANNWTYTVTGLPAFNFDTGHEYVYTVQEHNINKYESEVSSGNEDNEYIITNTFNDPLPVPTGVKSNIIFLLIIIMATTMMAGINRRVKNSGRLTKK